MRKNGLSVFLLTAHSLRLTGGGGGGGDMVSVAQRLEHWTVAPGVEGSNPFTHPSFMSARIEDRESRIAIFHSPSSILDFGERAASSVGRAADS